jgi:CheY-like chemotaxis protein
MRAHGRQAEVVLYDAGGSEKSHLPVLLDLKTRCRLASLGAIVTSEHAPFPIRGLIVHGAGHSALLAPPSGGLWSIDTPGTSGRNLVKRLLLDAAVARGASVQPVEVEAIEGMPLGEQRLRSQGRTETFQCVVGAFGSDSTLAEAWLFGRYSAPPIRQAWHVRVSWPHGDELIRLVVAPLPSIEALVFTPVGYGRASVLAIGRSEALEQGAVVEAIARLVRDGVLPGRLRFEAPGPLSVKLGAGTTDTLFRPGQLTIGSAVHGHLLDPGLYPALCSATRSARLLFTMGESMLFGERLELLQTDLVQHAERQPHFLKHARRAGPSAPECLRSVVATAGTRGTKEGGSLLGFSELSTDKAYRALRWAAWREAFARLFRPRASASARRVLALPAPLPRPRVYLLDDDEEVRSIVSLFLTSRGHDVRTFDSELSLVETAAREPPAAIVFDIVLQWMDGLSLCRLLREHPTTRDCALIAISNLGRQSDVAAALSAGADAFLPKPIDLTRLERLLGSVLEVMRRKLPSAEERGEEVEAAEEMEEGIGAGAED